MPRSSRLTAYALPSAAAERTHPEAAPSRESGFVLLPLSGHCRHGPSNSGFGSILSLRHECSSPLPPRRRQLRTHVPAIVLDGEDVAVEGRRPLLALRGHPEIPQRIPDI